MYIFVHEENAIFFQKAQRPRLFQATFEASLTTVRANAPQMTPLFELPPAAGNPPFCLPKQDFLFLHFSLDILGVIKLFVIYLFVSRSARHLFICSTHSDPASSSARSKRHCTHRERTPHRRHHRPRRRQRRILGRLPCSTNYHRRSLTTNRRLPLSAL